MGGCPVGDVFDVGGLVGFAAVRLWSEIGGVRFEHDAVEGWMREVGEGREAVGTDNEIAPEAFAEVFGVV